VKAAAKLGMDMPAGAGSHLSEMTFLGGGFASSQGMVNTCFKTVPDLVWVSLGTIKAQYYPTDVFRGTVKEQALQWAFICSLSNGGCPARHTFARMAEAFLSLETRTSAVDAYAAYCRQRNKWRPDDEATYVVTWDAWADMLIALCLSVGYSDEVACLAIVNEFREKSEMSFPRLAFQESWAPLYVARFGKLPAELVKTDSD